MSSILALPPPSASSGATSGAAAPSGTAKLRRMLTSDAIPVTPIRPIPDDPQRHPNGNANAAPDGGIGAPEDAVRRNGRTPGNDNRTRGTEETREGGAFRLGDAPPPPRPLPPRLSGGSAHSGFLTQSIAQEAMGSGLHIEPWSAAISAYKRADAGHQGPLVSNFAV